MIFFPEKTFYEKPEDYSYAYEDVFLKTSDGVNLHGWLLKGKNIPSVGTVHEPPMLLFFHGNAGNISNRLFKVKGWIERGFSVFLLDYRGYGKSFGKINHQDDVIRDAETAYCWLIDTKRVSSSRLILYGESLGSYAAIHLGSELESAAVILEAPFTSLLDIAKMHYPFVPEMLLKSFEFSNRDKIAELKAPLFILHGTRDEICPFLMAEELFEKAPEPKSFFSVENGSHNDLPISAGDDFCEKPFQFVEKHLT